MPDLSYDSIELNREHGPWEYPWRDLIDAYLEAVENAFPWHHERSPWGPPVAPPAILGNATLRFVDSIAPIAPGTLHAKFDLDITKALRRDRELIGYGKFAEKYERRGRRWAVFNARWRDGSGLIVGHSSASLVLPEEAKAKGEAEAGERREEMPRSKGKGKLTPISRTLTQERMTAYSQDSANAQRGQSIHSDPKVAKAHGFKDSVAQALMTADYISEMMTGQFKQGWLLHGKLSLAFVGPAFRGDTLTAGGSLREELDEGAFTRRVYDVRCENQDGEAVTVGTASGVVPAA